MPEIQKFDKIIVANWKLNGSINFIDKYLHDLSLENMQDKSTCVIFCPPVIYAPYLLSKLSNQYVGGQDCSKFNKGSFTGEISSAMLKDIGCNFCIIGHSERRQLFNETDDIICEKANNLIEQKINPIICVGETLEQKKQNKTKEVLFYQLKNSLPKRSTKDNTIIAYEPIWAIGTGLSASLEDINSIHTFIKEEISNNQNYKILYGGSVKSNNASAIMNQENVDGVLVGGGSLEPSELKKIMLS